MTTNTAVSVEEVCTVRTFYLGYCPKRGGEGSLIGILFLTYWPFLHLVAVSPHPHRTQVRGESCLFVFPLEPLSHQPWERRVQRRFLTRPADPCTMARCCSSGERAQVTYASKRGGGVKTCSLGQNFQTCRGRTNHGGGRRPLCQQVQPCAQRVLSWDLSPFVH